MNSLLERLPDNIFIALVIFLLVLILIALYVAIKQGRELVLWPPKLGPMPVNSDANIDIKSTENDHSKNNNVLIFASQIDEIIDVYKEKM